MGALPYEIVQALLASQGQQDEPAPDPQVPAPFPTPGAPHGYLDRLALALQGVQPQGGGQRYEGDSQTGSIVSGLAHGLAHGFSGTRVAEMKKRASLESALNQQAHDQNVANAEATKAAQEIKTDTTKHAKNRLFDIANPDTKAPAEKQVINPADEPLTPEQAKAWGLPMSAVGQKVSAHPEWKNTKAPTAMSFGMPDISSESQDALAQLLAQTGHLVVPGRGQAATAMGANVINRLPKFLAAGSSIASNQANYGADKASLAKMQANYDAVTAFEKTAIANSGVLQKAMKAVPDTGIPLLNGPVRAINTKLLGSAEMAAYNTALQVVVPEFAKILGNANMTGVLTDSQLKEVRSAARGDATIPQMIATLNTLYTDAHNRKTNYASSLAEIRARLSGAPPDEPQAVPPKSAAPPNSVYMESADGTQRGWVPANQKNQTLSRGWKLVPVK